MLIYNQRKEFIGVNEATLRRIGYNNIQELKEDVVDFADLFENRPGFVHNFKNFSWIDFILHSEQDDIKARIRCNGKIYSCKFKVELFFFAQESEGSEKGFSIELTDIQTIGDDDGSRPREIYEPEAPASMQMPTAQNTTATPSMAQDLISEPVSVEPLGDNALQSFNEPLSIEEPPPYPETVAKPISNDMDMEPLEMPELMIDEPVTETVPEPIELPDMKPAPTPAAAPTAPAPTTSSSSIELETAADYVFDPSVAADELGLPADLIDEFVGDFIVQAKKFQPDLEAAIAQEDFDTVQILSHKLKGVAANLRIEDALEVLTFINSSKDVSMLNEYLKLLFIIVHKLEHGADAPIEEAPLPIDEAPAAVETPVSTMPETQDDDLYSFDLMQNDDPIDIPKIPDVTDPIEMDTAPVAAPDPVIETTKQNTNFNLQNNAELLGVDTTTMQEYIHDFTDHANTLKTGLEVALKSSNFEEVKNIATELKGMSESLHLDYASQRLEVLQHTADLDEAIQNAKELFIFIRQL